MDYEVIKKIKNRIHYLLFKIITFKYLYDIYSNLKAFSYDEHLYACWTSCFLETTVHCVNSELVTTPFSSSSRARSSLGTLIDPRSSVTSGPTIEAD